MGKWEDDSYLFSVRRSENLGCKRGAIFEQEVEQQHDPRQDADPRYHQYGPGVFPCSGFLLSPLIGCGLYADDTAGAAVSTGVGEEAIRVLGSFLVVENMRRGAAPLDAVMEALKRVKKADGGRRGAFQLAFLAMTTEGEIAGGAMQEGFSYAVTDGAGVHELRKGVAL